MIIKDPVLVVDDEVEMRIAMSASLKHCGIPVELSHNAIDALNKFKKNNYSLVITDMTMPKRSGLELLKDIKKLKPTMPLIMITAYGTIDTAVEAMKYGAFDYIQKPFNFDSFIFLIERAIAYKAQQKTKLNAEVAEKSVAKKSAVSDHPSSYKDIITNDSEMIKLLDMAKNVARSKATVLIESESGTGKELLANFIHVNSDRAERPFVAVNCAALPETLLESELFGHKKGAFTGAINDHRGKFEQANGGTILLDEISEMSLPLQAKLLRVLQEHTIDRVGGDESIPIDIRVIATTNRILMEYVEKGDFREDLYFRLNVIPLHLPPLRERKGDIPILAEYFVKKFSKINGKSEPAIGSDVYEILQNYNWRGNIRELENVIERAVLLCSGEKIEPANLLMTPTNLNAPNIETSLPKTAVKKKTATEDVAEALENDTVKIKVGASMWQTEKTMIFETLKKTGGNRTKAADMLGISIRTLRNKLNEYKSEGEVFEYLQE